MELEIYDEFFIFLPALYLWHPFAILKFDALVLSVFNGMFNFFENLKGRVKIHLIKLFRRPKTFRLEILNQNKLKTSKLFQSNR